MANNADEFVLPHIHALCEERGWTLYKLAQKSGISYSTLNNMFHRNNTPSISTLNKICIGFGISLSDFFKENNESFQTLNSEQQELITNWNRLSLSNKKLLKTYLYGLLQEIPET